MKLVCNIDAIAENEIEKESIPIIIVLVKPKHQDYNFDFEQKIDNYPFVFLKDSRIARDIFNSPKQQLILDQRDFQIRKIEFDVIHQKFGYIHSELSSEIFIRQSSILNFEKKISDSLTECILSCHPEMYLYFILKVIWARELNHNTDYHVIKSEMLSRYFDVVAIIYMDKFKIRLPNFDSIELNLINELKVKYSDAIEYTDEIFDAVHTYISNNEEAAFVSVKMLQDEKYSYEAFTQRLMAEAYEMVVRRITKYKNSSEYFGHELSISDKRIELKIFPTPFGFTQVEELISLTNQNILDDLFKEYLSKNSFQYVGNEYLKDLFKTKWVFKHKDIISPFYVDRKFKLAKSKLNRQGRNNIFGSIIGQGQINLSTIFLEQ